MFKSEELSHYYRILKVEPWASWDDIRHAYHRASLEVHPDHGGKHEDMLAVGASTWPFQWLL